MTTLQQQREWYARNRQRHIGNVVARRKNNKSGKPIDCIPLTLYLEWWEERFRIGYAAVGA